MSSLGSQGADPGAWLGAGVELIERLPAGYVALAVVGVAWLWSALRWRLRERRMQAAVLASIEDDQSPPARIAARWEPLLRRVDDRLSRMRLERREHLREIERLTQANREARERFVQLPLAVFTLGPARRIVAVNRHACRLFNRTEKELLALDFPSLIRLRAPDAMLRTLKALLPPEFRGNASLEVVRPDGKRVPIVLWGQALDDDAGARVEQCVALDVTRLVPQRGDKGVDERHARDQIRDAMCRLAAGVAHEFNAHLTSILGHGLILKEIAKSDGGRRPHAAEICRAAEGARQLSKQLLAFSRTQLAYPVELDVKQTLLGMRADLEALAGRGVRVDLEFSQELNPVRVDRAQLDEIVRQLVVNAREMLAGDGWIVVQASRRSDRGEWLRLIVSNDGKSVPREVTKQAFEPYSTLGELGPGMRLAAVHGMVVQNGGRVRMDSEPKRGTSIEVLLPAISPTTGDRARPAMPSRARVAATVCVIEDEAHVRRLIVTVLEREGFRVLAASDGRAGLELCLRRADEIDLVLTDVEMPHMDGLRLAKELGAQYPDLALLYMSSSVFAEPSGSGAAAKAVLPKPFTPGELVSAVRDALQRSGQRRGGLVRVLVVEQDEPVRNMLRTLLRGLGYECTLVSEGEPALRELGRSHYDVVLTDMIPPEKGGTPLCAEIQARFPTARVIAMSTRDGDGAARLATALEAGAVSTLNKPFSMDELELALNLAIG